MKGEALKQKLPKLENEKKSPKQKLIYEKNETKKQELGSEICILEQKIGKLETEIGYIKSAIQSGQEYYPESI